ncbi:MAG TPA: hypothetical protein VLL75_03110 [Vicinamibacteria bacterium]|nr:hypothetical protein [Vicinamibacteria bacterium]
MDPITSTTAGVVSPKTTPAAPDTAAPSARVTDGHTTAAANAGPFAAAPAAASASDIPEAPTGALGAALGQEVLDRAFDTLEKLEKELKSIDPTTPEGAKRMAQITRQLNRVDEMIRMVNEIRRSRHEANMAVIDNIA